MTGPITWHSLISMRTLVGICCAALVASVAIMAPPAQADGLAWESCGPQQECAWLTVPIDHQQPDMGTIDLRVIRIAARGGRARGALVINPGGPGSSGVDFVRFFALSAPDQLRTNFDLVGFDPRGIGQSQPIRCLSSNQLAQYLRLDTTPRTPRAQRILMRKAARWSPGCLADQPRLAPFLASDQTVQDMDLLRAALGAPRLDFLGFSYGTLLGARYAEAFPDRVGRFVLDGGVDPTLDLMEISRDQAAGFQRAIRRFAADCARQDRCPLGESPGSVLRTINTLLRTIKERAIPTRGPTTLVQSQAIYGIVTALYSPALWPALRQALVAARRNDGTQLQQLAYLGSEQTGPERFAGNLRFGLYATGCLDTPAPPGRSGLAAAAKRWSASSAVPDISRALAWSNAPCHTWFRHGRAQQQVSSTTTESMLIVGTRYDPATPYRWSQTLNRALPTSSLLTYEGDGHTAFGSGVSCVDNAVTQYLLTGIARNQTCP